MNRPAAGARTCLCPVHRTGLPRLGVAAARRILVMAMVVSSYIWCSSEYGARSYIRLTAISVLKRQVVYFVHWRAFVARTAIVSIKTVGTILVTGSLGTAQELDVGQIYFVDEAGLAIPPFIGPAVKPAHNVDLTSLG